MVLPTRRSIGTVSGRLRRSSRASQTDRPHDGSKCCRSLCGALAEDRYLGLGGTCDVCLSEVPVDGTFACEGCDFLMCSCCAVRTGRLLEADSDSDETSGDTRSDRGLMDVLTADIKALSCEVC